VRECPNPNPALPGGSFCSREPGRENFGGAAPGPRTRETVCEAEAILQTRVAVEAEAGEARSPTPVRGGKEGEKT